MPRPRSKPLVSKSTRAQAAKATVMASVARKAPGSKPAGKLATAKKPSLPPRVTVVDGFKVYRSMAEPVHISYDQIARAIASVKLL